ncbi:GHMP kinases N terminal domain-containing protein, partial [Globomyces pollinis-pini]
GCHLTIKSEIPVGAGLGSSASYSVCLATAILLLSKKISYPLTDDHRHAINTLAFEAEKVIHGTPSGVDNTISTFGGAKIYQKGKGVLDLKGFPALSILLTDTNVPKNTKQQVELFAQRKLKYPKLMNNVIDSISNVVEEAIELFGRLGISSY